MKIPFFLDSFFVYFWLGPRVLELFVFSVTRGHRLSGVCPSTRKAFQMKERGQAVQQCKLKMNSVRERPKEASTLWGQAVQH